MIKRKPYLLFLMTASVLLCYSFVASDTKTMDVNVYDTYYVLGEKFMIAVLVVFTGILGLLYGIFETIRMPLLPKLTALHVYGSTVLLVPLLYCLYKSAITTMVVKEAGIVEAPVHNYWLLLTLGLLALLQVLFILNIFATVIKKFRNAAAQ